VIYVNRGVATGIVGASSPLTGFGNTPRVSGSVGVAGLADRDCGDRSIASGRRRRSTRSNPGRALAAFLGAAHRVRHLRGPPRRLRITRPPASTCRSLLAVAVIVRGHHVGIFGAAF